MVALKKYNLLGEEVGEVHIDEALLEVKAHPQMVKDYVVALRANARQWSANTLGRSEVKHTTKKPHRQKGTGHARQGNLVTPQFRGGGIVFGPKPKFDQHVRINKKERRLAIHSLLVERLKGGKIFIVEDAVFSSALKKPKTQEVASFLEKRGMAGRSVLFVGEGNYQLVGERKESTPSNKHMHFKLSMRNIPKAFYSLAANVSGYDLVSATHLVMTESAVHEFVNFFES